MGMRRVCKNLSVAMFIAAGCAACSIERGGLGCPPNFTSDETGRCQTLDASFDAGPFDSGPLDASFDAWVEPDADLMADAGPPDAWVDPDLGPDDAGPIDLGPDDLGPPDLGPDDLGPSDGGPPDLGPEDLGPPDLGPPDLGPPDLGPPDGGPIDAGPPSPLLRIHYVSGSGVVGIAYRVHWIPGPLIPTVYTDWFYDCWGRTTPLATGEECLVSRPEFVNPGAIVDMFPYDASGGTVGCTATTCPSMCTATTCPGTYTFEYPPRPSASGVLIVGLEPRAFIYYVLP